MKWQIKKLGAYYRDRLKWPLVGCVAGFLLFSVLSTVFFTVRSDLAASLMQFFMDSVGENILSDSGELSMLPLLLNNLRACLVSVLLGFIPFFFIPALSVLINAGIIGAVLAVSARGGIPIWLTVLVGLLPHGIFELPALFLGFSLGVSLCLTMTKSVVRLDGSAITAELKNIVRVYLLNILPLLVIAAAVECYVTPLLLSSVM